MIGSTFNKYKRVLSASILPFHANIPLNCIFYSSLIALLNCMLIATKNSNDPRWNYIWNHAMLWATHHRFRYYARLIVLQNFLCTMALQYICLAGQGRVISWWCHQMETWPFVRGIHRSPMNYTHKGQWRGALMISSICTWTNGWVNNKTPVIWNATALTITSL